MLGLQKSRLQSHARNREEAEERHAQRLRSIEERKERIADRLHRQHNSLAGRMQAMTKKGRARQAEQLERLDDRAAQLQGRAQRSFAALQERQFQAAQRDRIQSARDVKFLRLDNLEARRTHADHHDRTRAFKIDVREQQLKQAQQQAREQALKRELQQLHQPDRSRSVSR